MYHSGTDHVKQGSTSPVGQTGPARIKGYCYWCDHLQRITGKQISELAVRDTTTGGFALLPSTATGKRFVVTQIIKSQFGIA
jgi:hypothetical protein